MFPPTQHTLTFSCRAPLPPQKMNPPLANEPLIYRPFLGQQGTRDIQHFLRRAAFSFQSSHPSHTGKTLLPTLPLAHLLRYLDTNNSSSHRGCKQSLTGVRRVGSAPCGPKSARVVFFTAPTPNLSPILIIYCTGTRYLTTSQNHQSKTNKNPPPLPRHSPSCAPDVWLAWPRHPELPPSPLSPKKCTGANVP